MGNGLPWSSQEMESRLSWHLNRRGYDPVQACEPLGQNSCTGRERPHQLQTNSIAVSRINSQPLYIVTSNPQQKNPPNLTANKKRQKNAEDLPRTKYKKTANSYHGVQKCPTSSQSVPSEATIHHPTNTIRTVNQQPSNTIRPVNQQPSNTIRPVNQQLPNSKQVLSHEIVRKELGLMLNHGGRTVEKRPALETLSLTPHPEWIEDRELGNTIYVLMKLVPPFEEFKSSPACGDFNIRLSLKDRVKRQCLRRITRISAAQITSGVTEIPVPIIQEETILPDLPQVFSDQIIDLCDEASNDEKPNFDITAPDQSSPILSVGCENFPPVHSELITESDYRVLQDGQKSDINQANKLSDKEEQEKFIKAVYEFVKNVNVKSTESGGGDMDLTCSTQSLLDPTIKKSDLIHNEELEVTSSLSSSLERIPTMHSPNTSDIRKSLQGAPVISSMNLVATREQDSCKNQTSTDVRMTLYSPGGDKSVIDHSIGLPIIESNINNEKTSPINKRKHENTTSKSKKNSFMVSKYDYLFSKQVYESKLNEDKKHISDCYKKHTDSESKKKHKDKHKSKLRKLECNRLENTPTEKQECMEKISSNTDYLNCKYKVGNSSSEKSISLTGRDSLMDNSQELKNHKGMSEPCKIIPDLSSDYEDMTLRSKDHEGVIEQCKDRIRITGSTYCSSIIESFECHKATSVLSKNNKSSTEVPLDINTANKNTCSPSSSAIKNLDPVRIPSESSDGKYRNKVLSEDAQSLKRISDKHSEKRRRKSLGELKSESFTSTISTGDVCKVKRSISFEGESTPFDSEPGAKINVAKSVQKRDNNYSEICKDTCSKTSNAVAEEPAKNSVVYNNGILGDRNNNEQRIFDESIPKLGNKLVEIDMFKKIDSDGCTSGAAVAHTLLGKSLEEKSIMKNNVKKKKKLHLKYYIKHYKLRACSVRMERNPEIDLMSLHSYESPLLTREIPPIFHQILKTEYSPVASLSPNRDTSNLDKLSVVDHPKEVLDLITEKVVMLEKEGLSTETNASVSAAAGSSELIPPPTNHGDLSKLLVHDETFLKPKKISFADALKNLKKKAFASENKSACHASKSDVSSDIPPHVDPRLKQTTYCGMPPNIIQIDLTQHDDKLPEVNDPQKLVSAAAIHKYLRAELDIALPQFTEYICGKCATKNFDYASWRTHSCPPPVPISDSSVPTSNSSHTSPNSSIQVSNCTTPISNSSTTISNCSTSISNSSTSISNCSTSISNSTISIFDGPPTNSSCSVQISSSSLTSLNSIIPVPSISTAIPNSSIPTKETIHDESFIRFI